MNFIINLLKVLFIFVCVGRLKKATASASVKEKSHNENK